MDLGQRLLQERQTKFSHGLYHHTQVLTAYQNTRLDGNHLSLAQVSALFETRAIFSDDRHPVYVDDVFEVSNHFKLFDYLLDTFNQPLSNTTFMAWHQILKRGTYQADDWRYNVGGFKRFPNRIGPIVFVSPEQAPAQLATLLSAWENDPDFSIQGLATLHAEFENIHPFSDGNGIIGRLLVIKEALRFGQSPLSIQPTHQRRYTQGLRRFTTDPKYLIALFKSEQAVYQKQISFFYPSGLD